MSYVVFDSYNQSATFTRPVQFTDYESPRFTLTEPLVFQAGRGGRAMDRIGAEDSVDGDISSLVIQSGSDVDYGEAGEYTIHVEVTNRFGDLQTEALPVHVLEVIPTRAQLVLRTPLLYLNLGEIFRPHGLRPLHVSGRRLPGMWRKSRRNLQWIPRCRECTRCITGQWSPARGMRSREKFWGRPG